MAKTKKSKEALQEMLNKFNKDNDSKDITAKERELLKKLMGVETDIYETTMAVEKKIKKLYEKSQKILDKLLVL